MSLLVWLPLLGNLENQGVSNLQFTQSGTTITIDTNGKIGQCYNRATAKSAGRIESDNTILLNGDLSMCCWAKVTATVGDTANGLVTNHSAGSNSNFSINVKQISTDDYRISCSTGNGSARTYMTYYGTTNIKNNWHHLALTYNNTAHIFQLWVDGVVEKTQSYTNSATAQKIMLFDWNVAGTNNNYKPACMLNDVRIYDHCLSAAEVHEISQGLVLHYKLDNNGHRNLFTSDASRTATIASGATSAYTSYTYIDTSIKANGILKEGTEYTITYDYTVNSLTTGTSVYFYSQLNTSQCAPAANLTEIRNGVTSGHRIETFRATAAQASYSSTFRVRWRLNTGTAGDSITISNVRFYLGRPEDINYVSDCSGYGHNGTIVGSSTSSNDTARYSASTYMNATSTTNHIDCGQMPSTVQTISFWFKKTENSNFVVMAEPSSGLMFAPVGSYAVVKVATSNQTCYALSSPYYIDGQWNHIVVQKDGTTYKLWTNGVQRGSSGSNYYRHDGTNLWLFNRNYNASYAANGQISDLRVYTTLLSEADIKQLYEMGAKVDNKQNLHIYEAIEMQPIIKLTKQGQMKAGEFQEDTATKLYETNQIVETNNLIEF